MNIHRILHFPTLFFKNLWRGLTEPFEALPEPGDHRRAVTTCAFLLFVTISVVMEQMLAGNIPTSALLLLAIAYLISRTRWFKIAAILLIVSLTFPSYLVALKLTDPSPSQVTSIFAWVTVPLLIGSVIYNIKDTVIISVLNFVMLTLLPILHPEISYPTINATLGFFGLVSVILIVVMVQRNQMENDRRQELLTSQEKLSREILEREHFAEQAQHRADQLGMVNKINHAISNLQSLDGILQLIFEQVKNNFNPDVFFIALYDEKSQIISFPLMYEGGRFWDEPSKSFTRTSNVARALESNQPLIWNRTEAEIQAARNSGNRVGDPDQVAASIMIVPLQAGNRAIGAISLQSYKMGAYDDSELDLLNAIAQQSTVAIENARLFDNARKRAQHLAILNTIGEEISTLSDLPSLMENVFRQIQKIFPTDLFFIGLYNGHTNEFNYPIMYDNGRRWQQQPNLITDQTFSGKTILTRKPLLINDWADPKLTEESPPIIVGDQTEITRSLMFAPMLFGHEAIGVISSQSYKPNAYTEEDLNLLAGVAHQVAIAIENSRLYTSAQDEIKERQKIEEQLRSAEAKYRELVESVPAVIYSSESGATGRWFYVSPQIENLLGFTQQEWLADPNLWYQQIHPEDREEAVATEATLLAKGAKLETEYRIFTKNGRLIWLHDESTNVSLSNDQRYIVQGILTDISMRKQAEQTLRDSEEKFHSLFIKAERQAQELTLLSEVQSALASELDLSDLIHTVVEAIAKTFGYIFVSLYKLENGFLRLQHQVGYDNVIEKISPQEGVSGKVIHTGQPILIKNVNDEPSFIRAVSQIKSEICVPLFDGVDIFGILNVESSQDYQLTKDDLRLMIVLGEQINIGIRRARLYNDRAESLHREQHINDFAHTISSTLDLPNILEAVARLSVEMIGADTGNVSLMSEDGMEMTNVYSYNEDPSLNQLIPKGQGLTWLSYEQSKPVICDEYAQHPNAMPNWSATGLHAFLAVPVRLEEKRLGALTLYNRAPEKKFALRDVSLIEAIAREVAVAIQNAYLFDTLQKELNDHKQTQNQLQISVRQLEAKNAELERFTYSVSHDLKSPLVTIAGFLGFLEADIRKGETQRIEHSISRIRDAAQKMQRLLDELLELSRIGRLINPPVEIPFGDLVQEALELVHGELTAKQVQVQIEAGLPIVRVDRVRTVEVLQNLIVNAVKFMGDRKDPIIEIGMQIINGEKTFFVKDNGIGIAPAYHKKIFGLFDKLDAKSEGTGIGLALVKRIVEVHGGTIWVESEPGKGATFLFTLEQKNKQESI